MFGGSFGVVNKSCIVCKVEVIVNAVLYFRY